MELKRIIISEIHEQQVIMLKEVEGDRSFLHHDRHLRGHQHRPPRQAAAVAAAPHPRSGRQRHRPARAANCRDIYISELRDHTYYAKLRIRQNGEMVEVDCRPSDAIALAVTANVPIYVAEDVLDEVCGE